MSVQLRRFGCILLGYVFLSCDGVWAQGDPGAGIFIEDGQLVLTLTPAPDSTQGIRVWWNTEEPDRSSAVPYESFTPFVQPDGSVHLLTEINITDLERAFFFIGESGEFLGFTTVLDSTPGEVSEGPGAFLMVGIDLGAEGEGYNGTLDFSIIGNGTLYGEALPVRRTVTFDGRMQTVAVLELDDREVHGSRTIILRLDEAPLSDAAEYQKVITIEDDDYYWSGAVDMGFRQFPIRIQWTKAAGETRLFHLSDGSGVIPQGRFGESGGAPLSSLATPVVIPSALGGVGPGGLNADLTLRLDPTDESESEIRGDAAVTLTYHGSGNSHLDHTTTGTFILRREPHPVRDREPSLTQ